MVRGSSPSRSATSSIGAPAGVSALSPRSEIRCEDDPNPFGQLTKHPNRVGDLGSSARLAESTQDRPESRRH